MMMMLCVRAKQAHTTICVWAYNGPHIWEDGEELLQLLHIKPTCESPNTC